MESAATTCEYTCDMYNGKSVKVESDWGFPLWASKCCPPRVAREETHVVEEVTGVSLVGFRGAIKPEGSWWVSVVESPVDTLPLAHVLGTSSALMALVLLLFMAVSSSFKVLPLFLGNTTRRSSWCAALNLTHAVKLLAGMVVVDEGSSRGGGQNGQVGSISSHMAATSLTRNTLEEDDIFLVEQTDSWDIV